MSRLTACYWTRGGEGRDKCRYYLLTPTQYKVKGIISEKIPVNSFWQRYTYRYRQTVAFSATDTRAAMQLCSPPPPTCCPTCLQGAFYWFNHSFKLCALPEVTSLSDYICTQKLIPKIARSQCRRVFSWASGVTKHLLYRCWVIPKLTSS